MNSFKFDESLQSNYTMYILYSAQWLAYFYLWQVKYHFECRTLTCSCISTSWCYGFYSKWKQTTSRSLALRSRVIFGATVANTTGLFVFSFREATTNSTGLNVSAFIHLVFNGDVKADRAGREDEVCNTTLHCAISIWHLMKRWGKQPVYGLFKWKIWVLLIPGVTLIW